MILEWLPSPGGCVKGCVRFHFLKLYGVLLLPNAGYAVFACAFTAPLQRQALTRLQCRDSLLVATVMIQPSTFHISFWKKVLLFIKVYTSIKMRHICGRVKVKDTALNLVLFLSLKHYYFINWFYFHTRIMSLQNTHRPVIWNWFKTLQQYSLDRGMTGHFSYQPTSIIQD